MSVSVGLSYTDVSSVTLESDGAVLSLWFSLPSTLWPASAERLACVRSAASPFASASVAPLCSRTRLPFASALASMPSLSLSAPATR